MIQVKVNEQNLMADVSSLKTLGDIIELVKAMIDPDDIITNMLISGKVIVDADWRSPLTAFQNDTLEFSTGDRNEYVRQRFHAAEGFVSHIIEEFSRAADIYKQGASENANQTLAYSVDDLLAFINWYMSILAFFPHGMEKETEEFDSQVKELQVICEKIVQQQMFYSWWALGEMLKTELIPQLVSLKEFCIKVAKMFA